ncbi:MAG: D-glycero-beta-D-manno-heptose-7-phosphate kinase [Lentisphaerae bacterium]|nr:D-glycero-beta-D-manno-heptose-7-phosphate kinase [Lentisphaerota bacterium]
MRNNLKWAYDILSKFANREVLVVGDLMLDRYIYGEVDRISPEAPVPVVEVKKEKYMPGGGANVARNIQAMGGKASLCGVIGDDQHGNDLLRVLAEAGVKTDLVLKVPGVNTTVKTRVLAGRQQIVRIDWDKRIELPDDMKKEWLVRIQAAVKMADGVVLEDYDKGLVDQDLMSVVIGAAQASGVPCGFDPKRNTELRLDGITLVTPNRKEAFLLAGMHESPACVEPLKDVQLLEVSDRLRKKWNARFLVITLGPQGMLLIQEGEEPQHIPTEAREVFDVSGAGDTVIATMVLAMAAGAESRKAVELANCAAGVVVGKIGTASCSADELLNFLQCRNDPAYT